KPEPFLVELILNEVESSPEEVLVVGDRIDTDIDAGRAAGCNTLLVLTGVESDSVEGLWCEPDLRSFVLR
ncbi:HAD hydrolase-like protein, partial [Armatimonas sp.]|uniref:HAD hydrolase-like protein n=1 Tax=Armatimonas sp. TaxID=1872638 RepID=UPI00286ABB99